MKLLLISSILTLVIAQPTVGDWVKCQATAQCVTTLAKCCRTCPQEYITVETTTATNEKVYTTSPNPAYDVSLC